MSDFVSNMKRLIDTNDIDNLETAIILSKNQITEDEKAEIAYHILQSKIYHEQKELFSQDLLDIILQSGTIFIKNRIKKI